jgi:hypothetical protein
MVGREPLARLERPLCSSAYGSFGSISVFGPILSTRVVTLILNPEPKMKILLGTLMSFALIGMTLADEGGKPIPSSSSATRRQIPCSRPTRRKSS